jgi:peptide deformylase
MKIEEHLVQMFGDSESDRSILQREAAPVIMRFYKNNQSYRNCILEIVRYMDEHLNSKFEDYPDPCGVAAPNLGFPFRIIGYRKRQNENQFCLNPVITDKSHHTIPTTSNCGSLRLAQKMNVERHANIDFEYYDLEGNLVVKKCVSRTEGGFTIQHEIAQICGKTLLDYGKKVSETSSVANANNGPQPVSHVAPPRKVFDSNITDSEGSFP